jgi:hypothetical protein
MVPMLIVCWAMILFLRESVPTFCERYTVPRENRNTVCTFDPDSRLNTLSQAHRLAVGHIDHTGGAATARGQTYQRDPAAFV